MRSFVKGLGALLLLGACRSSATPSTRPAPTPPPPDVVPQAPEVPAADAGVAEDVPRVALPPVQSLRVGINGLRGDPQARACRGYALSYARPETHTHDDTEHQHLSDLSWGLGVANNSVEVRSTHPVEFHQATVRWFQAPHGASAPCHPTVDLEVGGRVVATFEPESACEGLTGEGYCVQQTTRTWSETARGESVRLVDRSRTTSDAGAEVCGSVQRLVLGDIPEPPQPMVIAHVGEMMHIPVVEGVGPGGYRFRVAGNGLFAVRPSHPPVRLTGQGVRALASANEVVAIAIPGSSQSYLSAAASYGNQGAIGRELYLADAAQPARGVTRAHAFASGIDSLWWDQCAGVLRVTTEDHRHWRVPLTGTVQEDPAADVGAP